MNALARMAAWLLPLAVAACLPGDTRPPPGVIVVGATGSEASRDGFVTDDGWTITFDDLVVSIGRLALTGTSCEDYYHPSYSRLLRLRTAAPQKVAQFYALGACEELDLGITGIDTDDLLGEGVSESDRERFRSSGKNASGESAGGTLFVSGRASRGGVEKRFSWLMRETMWARGCAGATLEGDKTYLRTVTVRPEVLFRDAVDDPTTRFDRFASADDARGDHDGEVTLAELELVPANDLTSNLRSLSDEMLFTRFAKVATVEGDPSCVGKRGGGSFGD